MNWKILIFAPTLLAAALAGCGEKKPEISENLPEVVVYKDPNCGCCARWVEHLRTSGFKVDVVETSNMSEMKVKLGVPKGMTSCHTAKIGNYVVEGHVPASSIKRLLKDKSAVAGLAVPGMPVGSPGMEHGGTHDAYNVVSFGADGETKVYDSF